MVETNRPVGLESNKQLLNIQIKLWTNRQTIDLEGTSAQTNHQKTNHQVFLNQSPPQKKTFRNTCATSATRFWTSKWSSPTWAPGNLGPARLGWSKWCGSLCPGNLDPFSCAPRRLRRVYGFQGCLAASFIPLDSLMTQCPLAWILFARACQVTHTHANNCRLKVWVGGSKSWIWFHSWED